MKKKLFCTLLCLLCISAQSLFAFVSTQNFRTGCISIRNPIIDNSRSAIAFPLLFLKGQNGIEKDEKKALNLLLEIEQFDSAKIWLAYCYEYGLGCEKDLTKTDKFLSETKSNDELRYYVQNFLITENQPLFALKLANLYYERTEKYQDAYSYILKDKDFKKHHQSEYEKLLKKAENSDINLINFLLSTHTSNRDFEKAIALLDYFAPIDIENIPLCQDPPVIPKKPLDIEFIDFKLKYAIKTLFLELINEGDTSLVEKLLSKKIPNKIFPEDDGINFSFAFCLRYGIGIEKDEKAADLLIENYLKAKIHDKFYKDTNQDLCSYVRNFKNSKFKETKDFIFYVAKKAADLGNYWLLAQCYGDGTGCEKDYEKSLITYEKITQIDETLQYPLDCAISCFKEICKTQDPSKDLSEKIFLAMLKNPRKLDYNSLVLFYALMQEIPSSQEAKEMAFKYLEENLDRRQSNRYNLTSIYFEIKAYCYQYGIGVEKDLEKAEKTRREMWVFLDVFVKTQSGKKSIYQSLRDIYTPKPVSNFKSINCPELYDFYDKKVKAIEDAEKKERIDKMLQDFTKNLSEKFSEQDIAFFFEFYEISKLFKNKNTLAKGEENLAKLYDKLIESKSEITELIVNYTIAQAPYYSIKTNLDLSSLKLRIASIPLWIKAGDTYSSKFYNHAAHCYEHGRGARPDKKLAAELYLKANNPFFAALCYLGVNDYDNALLAFQKKDERYYINSKIYLSETKHRDLKKANAYFLERLKNKENIYHNIAGNGSLESKYYNFLLHDRTYKAIDLDDGKSYSVVMDFIKDFADGIYCEKDLDKAVEIACKNRTPHILIHFLCDIEDNDPALFWEAIAKCENFWSEKFNSKNDDYFSVFKLLAMEESYGVERDEKEMDSLINNISKYRLNWIISKRDKFELSQNLLQKLYKKLEKNSNSDAKNFAILSYLLGKAEEAKKVINSYHKNGYTNFNASKLIDLYMRTRPLEDIALEFSLAKNPALKLAYATMLYKGQGCVADKEKAKEIFEQTASRWENDNLGLSANIWLWIYYTESGDTQKAKSFVDAESGFANLYTYKAFPMLAKMFKDSSYIPDLTKVYNLPQSDKYSNYFLSLMENEYFSTYAQDLIELYGQSILFKNLEKKLEIRAKAKAKIEELKSL